MVEMAGMDIPALEIVVVAEVVRRFRTCHLAVGEVDNKTFFTKTFFWNSPGM